MKCQMPGCQRPANHHLKIQGIYSGIYIEKVLQHCGRHRLPEINARVESIKNEAISAAGSVNPYLIAPLVARNVG